ncbi:hypothetical protein D3C86_1584700 [compost metagenome]
MRELRLDHRLIDAKALSKDGARRRTKAVPRNFVFAKPHGPQRGVDGRIAHWSLVASFAREHVGAATGERLQIAQRLDSLGRQWHQVRGTMQLADLLPLHARGRHRP